MRFYLTNNDSDGNVRVVRATFDETLPRSTTLEQIDHLGAQIRFNLNAVGLSLEGEPRIAAPSGMTTMELSIYRAGRADEVIMAMVKHVFETMVTLHVEELVQSAATV